MDRKERVAFLALGLFVVLFSVCHAAGGGVIRVRSKFAGLRSGIHRLREHDGRRHGRMLGAADLPLGGSSSATVAGLYYTELWIGSPPKHYFVQVDTGSDQLWVNCIQCRDCPKTSDLGLELTLYDPSGSSSGSLVSCKDDFCSMLYRGRVSGCTPSALCQFYLQYGDGSTSRGYFVRDIMQYNQLTGNFETSPVNASLVFGCSVHETGQLDASSQAVDGIMGFGQSNTSVISQLASEGKVKKMFAHCLDGVNGGGIFTIGQVVEPRVKMTPLVANQSHYNVYMKAIDVGGVMLRLPSNVFDTGHGVEDRLGTIIDSGTTLTYIAEEAFNPLMKAILSYGPHVQYYTLEGSRCFRYTGSVDDAFPYVTFYFENSVTMKVLPHEYLYQIGDFDWCIGFQDSGSQNRDSRGWTVLGDLVLANRLVVYDLENQAIGWANYDCSSSIKIKDSRTGAIHSVGAHNISLACKLDLSRFSLLIIILLHWIC